MDPVTVGGAATAAAASGNWALVAGELITAISGPAAATIVMALIIGGIFYIVIKHLIPAIKNIGEKHAEAVKTIVDKHEVIIKGISEEHREDRQIFQTAIQDVTRRIDRVEDTIDEIDRNIKDLRPR